MSSFVVAAAATTTTAPAPTCSITDGSVSLIVGVGAVGVGAVAGGAVAGAGAVDGVIPEYVGCYFGGVFRCIAFNLSL